MRFLLYNLRYGTRRHGGPLHLPCGAVTLGRTGVNMANINQFYPRPGPDVVGLLEVDAEICRSRRLNQAAVMASIRALPRLPINTPTPHGSGACH